VRVLSGEVDHRDSILSAAEREANEIMMTCVSRARGVRLVLEI
jgi:tetrachlorobenzoquinone reductase